MVGDGGRGCGGQRLLHDGSMLCGRRAESSSDVAKKVSGTIVGRAESASKIAGINYALQNRRGGTDDGYQRDNKSRDLVVDPSSSSFPARGRGTASR